MISELSVVLQYARNETQRDLGLRKTMFGYKIVEAVNGDRKNPVELTSILTENEAIAEVRKIINNR